MRYFDEYCEIRVEANKAPYQWVFRSEEPIQIRFGVALSHYPEQGCIALEIYDHKGLVSTGHVVAFGEAIIFHNYCLFSVTLPKGVNGQSYRYRLGYRDRAGRVHTSLEERRLLICNEDVRSIREIDSTLLGIVNHQPLYGPKPQVKITPGPLDWSKRLFYSLILDRFAQSTSENRQHLGWVPHNLTSPHASHGGSLRGLIEKLPYLKSLEVGAIIISPVYVNEADGYHGYHPIHLLMVEPRLGTLQTLQELVAKAHELDIAVILDVVVNHLADSIDWEDYGGPPGGEFKYVGGNGKAVMPLPIEAQNTALFHGPEYTDMINQRLFGFLEDWRTETPYVRNLLIQHLKYWLAVTDVDGFRYDSARHVGVDFWQPCVEEIDRYATHLGKRRFLQIAEHAGSTHEELTAYNAANFAGFIDYPTHYRLKKSLGKGDWLEGFADYFGGFQVPHSSYTNGWRNNLMFLDNQDTTRILHEFLSRHSNRDLATACLHFSLACLILGPQRPAIYAGTEQEFSGALGTHQCEKTGQWIGHDCHVREDMFDNPACVWKFGPINRKVFQPYSQEHSTFKLIQQLARVRRLLLGQEGSHWDQRTILHSEDHGLRCICIHHQVGIPPLLAVLNLGRSTLSPSKLPVPDAYGTLLSFETLAATPGSSLYWHGDHLSGELPPFAFILGQFLTVHQIAPVDSIQKNGSSTEKQPVEGYQLVYQLLE